MPGPVTKVYSVLMASPLSLSPPLQCVDIVLGIKKLIYLNSSMMLEILKLTQHI